MGSNPDMIHIFRAEMVFVHQVQNTLDRRLRMAAGRIHLTVGIGDQVLLSETVTHGIYIDML